jgi:Icc-related predicted phosphoesterase
MHVLLVSDLHYSLRQLDWLVSVGPDYDLVVVAGDSLDISSSVPLETQSVVIEQYVRVLGRSGRVAFSSGNHDLVGPDENGEQSALWVRGLPSETVSVDGESIQVDDYRITICPWWDGPIGREYVQLQLERDRDRQAESWIWVYHWPPSGTTTCWTGRRDYGDSDLRKWITRYQPNLVLTGHVHQSPFAENGSWIDRVGSTWVLNAGSQRGPVPAHIEIDLPLGKATWRSQMGTESVDLHEAAIPTRPR